MHALATKKVSAPSSTTSSPPSLKVRHRVLHPALNIPLRPPSSVPSTSPATLPPQCTRIPPPNPPASLRSLSTDALSGSPRAPESTVDATLLTTIPARSRGAHHARSGAYSTPFAHQDSCGTSPQAKCTAEELTTPQTQKSPLVHCFCIPCSSFSCRIFSSSVSFDIERSHCVAYSAVQTRWPCPPSLKSALKCRTSASMSSKERSSCSKFRLS